MVDTLHFEDLAPGRKFTSGTRTLDAAGIKSFARDFDPQPFHLDETAAAPTFFKELVASGWYTATVSMRLLVDGEFRPAGGIIGAGIDEFRWPAPVRPGDTLRVESEVLEARPSKSRPEIGIVRVRHTTRNQRNEAVQDFIANHVVQRRR
ncbi:MAG: MaoC family dehydratase [Alphaproteobacteria bacterium]|nr:MaoC family dehydratase [Alphaproteobacteria bacterium]